MRRKRSWFVATACVAMLLCFCSEEGTLYRIRIIGVNDIVRGYFFIDSGDIHTFEASSPVNNVYTYEITLRRNVQREFRIHAVSTNRDLATGLYILLYRERVKVGEAAGLKNLTTGLFEADVTYRPGWDGLDGTEDGTGDGTGDGTDGGNEGWMSGY